MVAAGPDPADADTAGPDAAGAAGRTPSSGVWSRMQPDTLGRMTMSKIASPTPVAGSAVTRIPRGEPPLCDRRSVTLLFLAAASLLAGCGDDEEATLPPEVQEIHRNRALWISVAPADYEYEFRWECACPPSDTLLVRITVVSDTVAGVVDAGTGVPVADPEDRPYRTIDGLFDWLLEAHARDPSSYLAEYDAAWGHPVAAAAGPTGEREGFEVADFLP
jgi:hypothetical protein